jgi:hypothetical protein
VEEIPRVPAEIAVVAAAERAEAVLGVAVDHVGEGGVLAGHEGDDHRGGRDGGREHTPHAPGEPGHELPGQESETDGREPDRVVGHRHHRRPRGRTERGGEGPGQEGPRDGRSRVLAEDVGERRVCRGIEGERL